MPSLKISTGQFALTMQGKVGFPTQLGWHTLGWSELGDTRSWQGEYMRRKKQLNFIEYDSDCYFGSIRFARERFGSEKTGNVNFFGRRNNYSRRPSWPIKNITDGLQTRQNIYSLAVKAWQDLTNSQKLYYNNNHPKKFKRGYDYFRSQYLKSY